MLDVVSPKLRALETAETLTETVKGPKGEALFDGVNSVPEYQIIIRRIIDTSRRFSRSSVRILITSRLLQLVTL